MKTSEFMDKKVTELSRSQSDDFSELSYSHGRQGEDVDEDSDSTFRFPCARLGVSSESYGSDFQNHSAMDFRNTRADSENVGNFIGGAFISVIDRKMEEHSVNLLHAVESLSVRLCQLETRTRKIEYSMDEFKSSSDFNHGRTEHKLTELGNVLTELQVGIRDLRDKQEISEVQIEMAKLQILKDHKQSEEEKTKVNVTSGQPVSSPSQFPVASSTSQLYSVPPNQPASSLPYQHFQHPSNQPRHHSSPLPQFPPNFPPCQLPLTHNPVDPPSHPLPTQNFQPHQLPLTHHPIDPQARPFPTRNFPPHQRPLTHNPVDHQSRPLPTQTFPPHQLPLTQNPVDPQSRHLPTQNSLPHQLPLTQNPVDPQSRPLPTQTFPPHQLPLTHNPIDQQSRPLPTPNFLLRQLPLTHNPVDPQFRPLPTQNFPPHQLPLTHNPIEPQARPSPTYYINTHNPHNTPAFPSPQQVYLGSRSSEFHPEHVQQSRHSSFRDEYSRNLSAPKPRFPQSPNPQVLPRALPMASEASSGSGSSVDRTSVSVDDVMENVVAMGFRRDLVRAAVKKITENGQSVDLNIVLDKLMNG